MYTACKQHTRQGMLAHACHVRSRTHDAAWHPAKQPNCQPVTQYDSQAARPAAKGAMQPVMWQAAQPHLIPALAVGALLGPLQHVVDVNPQDLCMCGQTPTRVGANPAPLACCHSLLSQHRLQCQLAELRPRRPVHACYTQPQVPPRFVAGWGGLHSGCSVPGLLCSPWCLRCRLDSCRRRPLQTAPLCLAPCRCRCQRRRSIRPSSTPAHQPKRT